jgi:hypothetical protein
VTTFIPPSTAVFVRVPLLGAGPGLNLDLATLSFHVPANISAADTIAVDSPSAATSAKEKTSSNRFIIILSFCRRESTVRAAYVKPSESAKIAERQDCGTTQVRNENAIELFERA